VRYKPGVSLALQIGLLIVCSPAFAHHSAAPFDTEHALTLKGTVTNFEWSNPHVFISLDVKDDKGNGEQWRVEGNSPNMLTRVGWKREMVKPGDQLSVTGFPAKNGKKIMRLESIMLANNQKFDGQGLKY
jgi:hypothetical protein